MLNQAVLRSERLHLRRGKLRDWIVEVGSPARLYFNSPGCKVVMSKVVSVEEK